MPSKKIISKVHVNKRNKQMTVIIPKRRLNRNETTLKEGEELFVELSILKKKKK